MDIDSFFNEDNVSAMNKLNKPKIQVTQDSLLECLELPADTINFKSLYLLDVHFNTYLLYLDLYYESERWKKLRDMVLKRDNYLCQCCMEKKAVQAHHRIYDHVFNEPLFDLEAICLECHGNLTDMDRFRSKRKVKFRGHFGEYWC